MSLYLFSSVQTATTQQGALILARGVRPVKAVLTELITQFPLTVNRATTVVLETARALLVRLVSTCIYLWSILPANLVTKSYFRGYNFHFVLYFDGDYISM